MPNHTELLQKRESIDAALRNLIQQGELVAPEEKKELDAKYSELWGVREEIQKELAALPVPRNRIAGIPAEAPAAGVPIKRKIRWGVVAVGGIGVLSLIGLIGWQLYVRHEKKKTRRRKRR